MVSKTILYTLIAIIAVIIIVAGVLAYNYYIAQQALPTLKIGVIMELTGELARDGLVCKRGYDVWYKVVSEKGGVVINGKLYKIELKYYDTRSDPGQAATAVEKAVSDGMDILLGPYSSANTLGAIPVANKYGIPMFAGSPESHLIPQQKSPYVFQTLLTTKETPLAFRDIISRYGIKTAALVSANDAFSQGLASTFRSLLNSLGVSILVDETFPVDITDLKPLMSKVASSAPELIIVAAHHTHQILATKALREIGYNPKMMIIHAGIDSPEVMQNVRPIGEGIIGLILWRPVTNWKDPVFGDLNSFLKAWNETYPGVLPDYTGVSCAATASYVIGLLQKYGIEPPLKNSWSRIKDLAEKESIETILGPIRYSTDPDHWHVNTELLKYVMIGQFQGGKLVVVYPDNVKEANMIFPKPAWR
jgi:branched-chain amino acid transport system substrate-binding protein